jgi:uncharacterized membrane protein YhdT
VSMENNSNHEFVEDPRYRQCNREALLGLGLGLVNLIWWFAWGYGLGARPPEEYTYMFGFPTWFFMSCIVGGALFTILSIVMVKMFYRDMPLGELTEEEARKMEEVL